MQGKKEINVKLSELEIKFCLNCPHWRCISGGNKCLELRRYLHKTKKELTKECVENGEET